MSSVLRVNSNSDGFRRTGVLAVFCILGPCASFLTGCGFDFDRTFSDSASAPEPNDTDTDGPDFSLEGFANVDGTTTGGKGGDVVEASSYGELATYASDTDALVIRISNEIALDAEVNVASNKTVEGVGDTARITGNGFKLNGVENVIIRNLGFSGAALDAISIENTHHVWVDHNRLSGASDELIDVKSGSSYITLSWNHFHSQDRVCLIGASDEDGAKDRGRLKVTVHHNWFNGTKQQHPRCRFGEIHAFNNFYDNIHPDGYGIASTTEAKVFSESNSFLNVNRPFSLAEGTSPSGALTSKGDLFDNCGELATGSVSFSPSDYYTYSVDESSSVATLVKTYAGVGIVETAD